MQHSGKDRPPRRGPQHTWTYSSSPARRRPARATRPAGKGRQGFALAAGIVGKIPRLEVVADIIRLQDKHFDGGGLPQQLVCEGELPLGARVLKCGLDYERLLTAGQSSAVAVETMSEYEGRYDPAVLVALREYLAADADGPVRTVSISELTAQMRLAEDVVTSTGVLLVPRGIEASDSVQAHLRRFLDSGQIENSVAVY